MNDKRMLQLATDIYNIVDGADNRTERAAHIQEIYEWLVNGDAAHIDAMSTQSLAAEWREYSM